MNDKTQPDNQDATSADHDPVRECSNCRFCENRSGKNKCESEWWCDKYKKNLEHHYVHGWQVCKLPECVKEYGYEPPGYNRRSEAQPTKDHVFASPDEISEYTKRVSRELGDDLLYFLHAYRQTNFLCKPTLDGGAIGRICMACCGHRVTVVAKGHTIQHPNTHITIIVDDEKNNRFTATAPTEPDDGDGDLFEGPMYEPEKHRGTETAPTEPEPQKPDDAVVLQRAANGSIALGNAIIKLVQRHSIYRSKAIKLLHENNDLLNKVRELQLNVDVRDDRMTALEQEINNLRLRRDSLEHDNKELQQQNSSLYEDLANG